MSQLKCNPLHYAIATLTSATTFNQKKLVAKLLWLPFLGLLLHFFGVAVDRKSCSDGNQWCGTISPANGLNLTSYLTQV